MPTWRSTEPDGGTYVLRSDLALPPQDQVTFRFRDPNPLEVAEFEERAGYVDLSDSLDSRGRPTGAGLRWVSSGPSLAVKALLRFLTDVSGPGPDGQPLAYPAPGRTVPGHGNGSGAGARPATDADRLAFLGRFAQADLYEVADHILEGRKHLGEEERGNSPRPPRSSGAGRSSTTP